MRDSLKRRRRSVEVMCISWSILMCQEVVVKCIVPAISGIRLIQSLLRWLSCLIYCDGTSVLGNLLNIIRYCNVLVN